MFMFHTIAGAFSEATRIAEAQDTRRATNHADAATGKTPRHAGLTKLVRGLSLTTDLSGPMAAKSS